MADDFGSSTNDMLAIPLYHNSLSMPVMLSSKPRVLASKHLEDRKWSHGFGLEKKSSEFQEYLLAVTVEYFNIS